MKITTIERGEMSERVREREEEGEGGREGVREREEERGVRDRKSVV